MQFESKRLGASELHALSALEILTERLPFMTTTIRLLLLLAISQFAVSIGQAAERPNILFIFLDDFGWKDTSYMGSDFYPTFVEIAGAKMPDQPQDGRSLVPLLTGEIDTLGERPLFWHFPAYLQSYAVYTEQRDPLFRSRPCSIVRMGDWKLHEYFEDRALLLFNLKDDIREQKNLADSHPEKRKQLHDLLLAWREKTGAPVPTTANPQFDADAEAQAIRKAQDKVTETDRPRRQKRQESEKQERPTR